MEGEAMEGEAMAEEATADDGAKPAGDTVEVAEEGGAKAE